MSSKEISNLRNHAVHVSSDLDLIQGSGGNVSYKNGAQIWVKASGMKLSLANDEDIFCKLDYKNVTLDELKEKEDFSDCVTGNLRPSIEVNFHILIRFRYVTHLHSLGAIAIGFLKKNALPSELNYFGFNFAKIPYIRPGRILAKYMIDSDMLNTKILVLQNHGVIFSSNDLIELENLIHDAESAFRSYVVSLPISDEFPSWVEILLGGVLTPDEAVFLGRTPFTRSNVALTDTISISNTSELLYPKHYSDEHRNLANFYVRLAKLIEKRTQVSYLSEDEVNEILNWDKEKLRIEMFK
jgi:rhamnose utilization protein RhaD (predicted bifunctional aldolase and dehydrogenase)